MSFQLVPWHPRFYFNGVYLLLPSKMGCQWMAPRFCEDSDLPRQPAEWPGNADCRFLGW